MKALFHTVVPITAAILITCCTVDEWLGDPPSGDDSGPSTDTGTETDSNTELDAGTSLCNLANVVDNWGQPCGEDGNPICPEGTQCFYLEKFGKTRRVCSPLCTPGEEGDAYCSTQNTSYLLTPMCDIFLHTNDVEGYNCDACLLWCNPYAASDCPEGTACIEAVWDPGYFLCWPEEV